MTAGAYYIVDDISPKYNAVVLQIIQVFYSLDILFFHVLRKLQFENFIILTP